MDSRALAAELAPKAVAVLEANRAELLADLPWGRRKVVEWFWPWLLAKLPTLLAIAVEILAERFGRMTIGEVIDALRQIRTGATYLPRE